jgi:hypothetical protein
MRTFILGLAGIAAAGLVTLASQDAQALPLPAMPKANLASDTSPAEQVRWRGHRHHRHWGHGPRYGAWGGYPRYRSYGYGYPRYRSYGYYGGGFPGISLYIGPRHRWGRW